MRLRTAASLIIALAGLPGATLAQGQPPAAAASSAPATSDAVTIADLEGSTIEANITEYRIHRTANGTGPVRAYIKHRVAFGPGDAIKNDVTMTIHRLKKGDTNSRTHSGSSRLGQPHKFRDGEAIWVLENGVLTHLRTQNEGALMIKFLLKRSDKGLTCEVDKAYARENGKGSLQSTSTNFGVPNVELLSVKQESATCRVKPPASRGR